MDCRSCGVVNAPGRRYCRECGARLGQSCPACHFFNGAEDNYCGGCGGRLKAGVGPLVPDSLPVPSSALAVADELSPSLLGDRVPSLTAADAGIGGQGVSQSEIDALFENILDEELGESAEEDA